MPASCLKRVRRFEEIDWHRAWELVLVESTGVGIARFASAIGGYGCAMLCYAMLSLCPRRRSAGLACLRVETSKDR